MRRIAYADAQFVTTDAIAAKVLEYAKLMGRAATDDVVQLPTVDDAGAVRSVDILLGPASQMTSAEVDGPEADLDSGQLLAELDRRIATLRQPHAEVVSELEPGYDPDLDDSAPGSTIT
ncbi:hypothetical protein [Naasia aerilata]|uniref:Uncharacterized protein n=1 Tax=Naasia aerilata TaxID=1162966 RepID=A0ABM8G859_9MICO|nr:hypothetical protein [Naasia aerilata]BDZ44374.1 hypothetical protein GCM10025866_02830 [Naasia aerilata]